jgi:hypothetical protein
MILDCPLGNNVTLLGIGPAPAMHVFKPPRCELPATLRSLKGSDSLQRWYAVYALDRFVYELRRPCYFESAIQVQKVMVLLFTHAGVYENSDGSPVDITKTLSNSGRQVGGGNRRYGEGICAVLSRSMHTTTSLNCPEGPCFWQGHNMNVSTCVEWTHSTVRGLSHCRVGAHI